MSNKKLTICGVPCSHVVQGDANGTYLAVFSSAEAPLSAVEKIDWSKPVVKGDCILPAGYGLTVKSLTYEPAYEAISVELEVAAQYLGDVTGYAAQVAELQAEVAEKDVTIQALEADVAGKSAAVQSLEEQLAETDEALIALYEAQEVQDSPTESQDNAQEGGEVSV